MPRCVFHTSSLRPIIVLCLFWRVLIAAMHESYTAVIDVTRPTHYQIPKLIENNFESSLFAG